MGKLGAGWDVEFNKNLSEKWLNRHPASSQVVLLPEETIHLHQEVLKLTAPNGDRVAGNLNILQVMISSTMVQLLVEIDPIEFDQKISRLKSRLATLLSFYTGGQKGGKNTWSKGYWSANFTSEEVKMLTDKFMYKFGSGEIVNLG